jgi:ornithine carbamoyltransferase
MLDISSAELEEIIELSLGMKRDGAGPLLAGQTLALIFEKPSLRTRISFEQAMHRLGGRVSFISAFEVQMGEREPVRDIARVLSGYVQAIGVRTFAHATVREFSEFASVPVINALSEDEHPCQALADLLTLRERFGDLNGVRLTYVGEGNNVARSLAYASVMTGIDFTCASPEGFGLPAETLEIAGALEGSGSVTQTDEVETAVGAAAAVYTDVWASMGHEDELQTRVEIFKPYQLNAELLAHAPPDAIVMHDMPAHRGEEITDDVIESDRAVVFQQAENRMHAQQAMLALVLGGSPS